MLISPKTNPFSIDSLLGIKDAETSRDNNQTATPDFETEYNSKDKTVNEKDTEFKRHEIDQNNFHSLIPTENSSHFYGKSDYNSDHAFRVLSEQRQSDAHLGYCRMRWWEPNRQGDHFSPWSYRYPLQGSLPRYIGKVSPGVSIIKSNCI